MESDRFSVSLDFKISKNYNSIGGSVSYCSSQKENESTDELFLRIYEEVGNRLTQIESDAITFLDTIKK